MESAVIYEKQDEGYPIILLCKSCKKGIIEI